MDKTENTLFFPLLFETNNTNKTLKQKGNAMHVYGRGENGVYESDSDSFWSENFRGMWPVQCPQGTVPLEPDLL